MRNSLHGAAGLADLNIDDEGLRAVAATYPFRVTPYYLSLAKPGDTDDPIWKQCVPDVRELNEDGAGESDPFSEHGHMPVPGLIHRYPDRAVVIATTRCAVRCRHCTRKNTLFRMSGDGGDSDLDEAIAYVRNDTRIREVIVSGGDPLLLEDERLDRILDAFRFIPHVDVMRIGTRVPVVLPMRVNAELAEVLKKHRPLWVNTQFNHPSELTAEALAACERLICAGIPVSNQAVLLRGVNDDLETMRELCNTLQSNMIRPYYVFQCDPLRGAVHFRTPVETGVWLEDRLRRTVGGLSVPRFVADVANSEGKVPLSCMQ